MRILCVFGQHNYGDPARGQGYEYSNFLPALRNLGHEVEVFDSFSRAIYADFADLNRALLDSVERFRPDLVFCVLMGYEVWLETLSLIRKSGVRLVNWGTDDSWKYDQFSHFVSPAFDIAETYKLIVAGCNNGFPLDYFFNDIFRFSFSNTGSAYFGRIFYGLKYLGNVNNIIWSGHRHFKITHCCS